MKKSKPFCKKRKKSGHRLTGRTGNTFKEILLTDEFSKRAVTTPLYNIGEQVYKLSSEFKSEHTEIILNIVFELRYRLVHDYDGVN